MRNKDWEVEFLNLKDIRENEEWRHPSYLIDWLLESDYHVILCQGIHNGMFGLWKPVDCLKEMLRLHNHPGFPNRLHLLDPVISADKFDYLCAAHKFCLPSFKMVLTQDSHKMTEILESIQQFIAKYSNFDGDLGFIIKAPFVQNQSGFPIVFFKTYQEFTTKLLSFYTKENRSFEKKNVFTTSVFPYLIVQPRMTSSNESKIILWNGKAQFISTSKKGLNGRKTKNELMQFAELACKHLKEQTRGVFLCDGIVRVDLFCTIQGTLIVNEFESLDANYCSTIVNEYKIAQMITDYYGNLLSQLIM